VYKETLDELKSMPQDAAYVKSVQSITQQRMQCVEQNQQSDAIVSALNTGCMEEILVQAHDELALAKRMKEWKPWEPLEVKPAANQWAYFK
jgi:NADH dehydrogenase (ubiquinone) 1 alpha subcomplex subunit 5